MSKTVILFIMPALAILGFVGGRMSTILDQEKVMVEENAQIRELKLEVHKLKRDKADLLEEQEKMSAHMSRLRQKALVEWKGQESQTFKLSRAFISKSMEDLPTVLRQARAVPYVDREADGEVSGFKLVAIKPGSVYEKVGLQNGDIVKGIDGKAIDTPQKAMELYQSLKKNKDVKIQIIRAGKKNNLNIQLEK